MEYRQRYTAETLELGDSRQISETSKPGVQGRLTVIRSQPKTWNSNLQKLKPKCQAVELNRADEAEANKDEHVLLMMQILLRTASNDHRTLGQNPKCIPELVVKDAFSSLCYVKMSVP